MRRKRVHGAWISWGEKAVERAIGAVTHSFFDAPPSEPECAGDAADSNTGHTRLLARWLQQLAAGDNSAVQHIGQWIETHGEDAWLELMSQWERLTREIVDEMLDDRPHAKKRNTSTILRKWDRAARIVTETFVDAMMETGRSSKKPPPMRGTTETSEIHEYMGSNDPGGTDVT